MTSCSSVTRLRSSIRPKSATTKRKNSSGVSSRPAASLKEGSDPPRGMAALLMHQALAMDVEAGVPPMKAIQAATLNVAKTFKKDKDYGSVEPGKVADLVHRRGRSAARHLDDAKRQDGRHGREGHRYRIQKIQESDPVILFLPELAAGSRNLAALSYRGFRSHDIEGAGAGGMWPFHQGHAEWSAATDQLYTRRTSSRRSFHPRRFQRRAHTSLRSNATAKRFPNPIGPISWWALSHSEVFLNARSLCFRRETIVKGRPFPHAACRHMSATDSS